MQFPELTTWRKEIIKFSGPLVCQNTLAKKKKKTSYATKSFWLQTHEMKAKRRL